MYFSIVFLKDLQDKVLTRVEAQLQALPKIGDYLYLEPSKHDFEFYGEVTKITHICSSNGEIEVEQFAEEHDFINKMKVSWAYQIELRQKDISNNSLLTQSLQVLNHHKSRNKTQP